MEDDSVNQWVHSQFARLENLAEELYGLCAHTDVDRVSVQGGLARSGRIRPQPRIVFPIQGSFEPTLSHIQDVNRKVQHSQQTFHHENDHCQNHNLIHIHGRKWLLLMLSSG